MSKNQSAAIARPPARSLKNVRTLVVSAVLAAISVVLARLIIPMPDVSTRFSLEAVPIFLAGMFFGPIPGALVGFSADLVGCLFSGYGYNPLFCVLLFCCVAHIPSPFIFPFLLFINYILYKKREASQATLGDIIFFNSATESTPDFRKSYYFKRNS